MGSSPLPKQLSIKSGEGKGFRKEVRKKTAPAYGSTKPQHEKFRKKISFPKVWGGGGGEKQLPWAKILISASRTSKQGLYFTFITHFSLNTKFLFFLYSLDFTCYHMSFFCNSRLIPSYLLRLQNNIISTHFLLMEIITVFYQ